MQDPYLQLFKWTFSQPNITNKLTQIINPILKTLSCDMITKHNKPSHSKIEYCSTEKECLFSSWEKASIFLDLSLHTPQVKLKQAN